MFQGVLAAGDGASGLRWLQKGFGFTDEDDRLWALGWPHMFYVVPGDVPAKALTSADAFFKAFDPPYVPEGMLPRLLRAYDADHADIVTALGNGAPIDDDEAIALAKSATSGQFGHYMIYALEALRSPGWVLEHVIGAYEAWNMDAWNGFLERSADNPLRALPMVMLRASKADADRALARLKALAARLKEKKVKSFNRAYVMLKTITSPSAKELWTAHLVTPAQGKAVAALVVPALAKMKPADRMPANARWGFLGGDAVLKAFAKHAKQFRGPDQKELAMQLLRCKHPAVGAFMKTVGGPLAKKWGAPPAAPAKAVNTPKPSAEKPSAKKPSAEKPSAKKPSAKKPARKPAKR